MRRTPGSDPPRLRGCNRAGAHRRRGDTNRCGTTVPGLPRLAHRSLWLAASTTLQWVVANWAAVRIDASSSGRFEAIIAPRPARDRSATSMDSQQRVKSADRSGLQPGADHYRPRIASRNRGVVIWSSSATQPFGVDQAAVTRDEGGVGRDGGSWGGRVTVPRCGRTPVLPFWGRVSGGTAWIKTSVQSP